MECLPQPISTGRLTQPRGHRLGKAGQPASSKEPLVSGLPRSPEVGVHRCAQLFTCVLGSQTDQAWQQTTLPAEPCSLPSLKDSGTPCSASLSPELLSQYAGATRVRVQTRAGQSAPPLSPPLSLVRFLSASAVRHTRGRRLGVTLFSSSKLLSWVFRVIQMTVTKK